MTDTFKDEKPEFKVPLKRVPSDDCVVYLTKNIKDGELIGYSDPIYPHKGEWVEILPIPSLEQYIALSQLINTEDTNKQADSFEGICRAVASRVVDWTWTGFDNRPLPRPFRQPDVIKMLTSEEVLWLLAACQGESQGERKND